MKFSVQLYGSDVSVGIQTSRPFCLDRPNCELRNPQDVHDAVVRNADKRVSSAYQYLGDFVFYQNRKT